MMNNMITISVIVPIYNVESYLDECIQSVFSQTYTNIEIILVDDGSPDNCPKMCDAYAQKDNRVVVIHKSNGGLSDARNAGLIVATGDYVIFLDSDDFWLEVDFLNTLVGELENEPDVDLILFGRKDFYEESGSYVNSGSVDVEKVNGKIKTESFRYLIVSQLYSMSAWSKLIKRELLVSNHIFFEKGLLGEDMDWSLQLWSQLNTVRAINCYGYAYRHRSGSITTTYNLKNVSDFVYILHKWHRIATEEMTDVELSRLFLGYIAFLYPTLLRNFYLIQKSDRKTEYNLLKDLVPLLKYSMTEKTAQVAMSNKYFGFKITVFVFGIYGLVKKRGVKGLKLFFK